VSNPALKKAMRASLDYERPKKRGRPPIGRKSVGLKLFPETIRALAEAAEAEGVDKSTFCERAIRAYAVAQEVVNALKEIQRENHQK
jgi:uncharacterized protein (DUF1778 family)